MRVLHGLFQRNLANYVVQLLMFLYGGGFIDRSFDHA
jgi:hypothetical protein